MDWTSENCRKQFMALRSKINKTIQKASYENKEEVVIDCYNDVCLDAAKNDPIAQDYLSYIFKKGLESVIPVNFDKSMKWQILAAANGNQFAIDKLALFLSHALNEIMMANDIGYIIARNELSEQNFNYIVGRLVCEAIADELQLNAERMIKEGLSHIEFNPKLMLSFNRARSFAIPKVLKFLRS
ncbi:MAG: hypothetical protein PHX09_01665 [Clostridia bacterium]|nr:hypothetical protein [Clostridia bacterium]MDD4685775.1 hypothetical protein [Clostridia bacterium]